MLKISGGRYKGRNIYTSSGPGYRPATSRVRESLFSTLFSLGFFQGRERVLDVFAGSGSLGFEALSRGAKQVCFLEKDQKACRCIWRTAKELGVEQKIELYQQDVFKALAAWRGPSSFELIFVDPPYGLNYLSKTLDLILKRNLLAEHGILIAEVEKKVKIAECNLTLLKDKLFGQTRILLWKK